MGSFWRIFKYVWPQWPRVVVIVFTAIVIAILFAGSFVTVIPLLKVMMGEEGLHGWVDRKVSGWRYDVEFYVPESTDLVRGGGEVAYYLLVTDVKEKSKAEAAGLRREDRIVGVGGALVDQHVKKLARARLLEELAMAGEQEVLTVQVRRFDEQGASE